MHTKASTRYFPGDHLVICDLSGFKFLFSECRYTWDGLLVYKGYWYAQHPQLQLRAHTDRIAVQNARTRQGAPLTIPLLETHLVEDEAAASTTLRIAVSLNISVNDLIQIALDDGAVLSTVITAISSSLITIQDALPSAASFGNSVSVFAP